MIVNESLLLAAHGSRVASHVNRSTRQLADRIRRKEIFREVLTAFHHGSPGFETATDLVTGPRCTIVPLMTSAGYFSQTVLPQAIFGSPAVRGGLTIEMTEPVGRHPDIAGLLGTRIRTVVKRFDLDRTRMEILLVGHGTPRNPHSRNSTFDLARQLRTGSALDFATVRSAFIDDDPGVARVFADMTSPTILVIPFLMSSGPHSRIDIPRSLALPEIDPERNEPTLFHRGARKIIVDQSFGTMTDIDDLVIDLALRKTNPSTPTRSFR